VERSGSTQPDLQRKARPGACGGTRPKYNLCGMPCYQNHIDSGERWLLMNVINNPVWKRDAKGNVFTNTYDELNRPLESIVDNGTTKITYQKVIYGEGATTPESLNLKGKPWKSYDGNGETVVSGYDFKGAPISTTLKFTSDCDGLPNWSGSPALESAAYINSMEMDALGRLVSITSSDEKLPKTLKEFLSIILLCFQIEKELNLIGFK